MRVRRELFSGPNSLGLTSSHYYDIGIHMLGGYYLWVAFAFAVSAQTILARPSGMFTFSNDVDSLIQAL